MSVFTGADGDSDPTNNLTGDGRLLVDDVSLLDPDDLHSARAYFDDGVLAVPTDGRAREFEASGADVLLSLNFSGTAAVLHLHDAHVAFDIPSSLEPTGDPPLGGGVVNGLIGGALPLDEAARFFTTAYPTVLGEVLGGIDEPTLRAILSGQADMDLIPEGFSDVPCTWATMQQDCAPGQGCEQDPDRGRATYCCEYDENPDAISVAFVFTVVSCDIVGIHHGAP